MRGAGDIEAAAKDSVHLSVVVPVYGCQGCLTELHRRLVEALERFVPSFEIILVNDASPDRAWATIEELSAGDRRVRGIDLSRNFGQHRALAAGLDRAGGEWTVVMDCDLQHPPEEIARLYRTALEGHDIVIGRRAHRHDAIWRRAASRVFSWVHGLLTGTPYDSGISNFSIVSRPVLREVRRLREQDRAYTSLLHWVGFDVAVVDFAHADRYAGRTSYGPAGLVRFALESIASQPDRPLRLSAGLGLLLMVVSALGAALLIHGALRQSAPVPGWAIVLVSTWLLGGLMLLSLAALGVYVGKLFEQAKGRPLYVVRRTVNLETPRMEKEGQR